MFSSLFGGAGGAGLSPSAFMSPPGMTPQQWAMMLAMQNQQGQPNQSAVQSGAIGAPQLQPGQKPVNNFATAAGAAPLQNNPNMIQQLQQILQMRALMNGMGTSGQSPAVPAPAQ